VKSESEQDAAGQGMNRDGVEESNPPWKLSWVDQVQDALGRASFPWWLPLIFFPIVLIVLETVLLFQESGPEALTWPIPLGLMVIYAMFPFYVFGFLYFVDERARIAILRLRPLLDEERKLDPLSFTLSNMPSLPTILASLAGFVFFLGLRSMEGITGDPVLSGTTQITRWIRLSEGAVLYPLIGVITYHTIRQLAIINRIYARHVRIDLLNQTPLYELARIPVYTALSLVIPVSLILMVLPRLPNDPVSISMLITTLTFTIVIVIAPIYRVHLVLDDEKVKRQNLNSNLTDALLARFRKEVGSNSYEGASGIRTSLEILKLERDIIHSAPTWPWPAGSMRTVAAALLFPTTIWLIQQLLQSIFASP
jgi:hypothetical protein